MKRTLLFALYLAFCASILGCTPSPKNYHKIQFNEPTCIKPHNRYNFLTCHKINVDIDGKNIAIPSDFDTDLASIPRWLWSIISPNYSGFISPAILHDYLYRCSQNYTRKTIDEIFYYALISNGVSRYTAYKMYAAVRLFGAPHFKEFSYCIHVDANKKPKNYEHEVDCD